MSRNDEREFEAAMMRLFGMGPPGVPRLQPEKPHHHKCGNCGHIWAHTKAEAQKVDYASYKNGGPGTHHAHECPKGCKSEDWDKRDSRGRDYFDLRRQGLPLDYTV